MSAGPVRRPRPLAARLRAGALHEDEVAVGGDGVAAHPDRVAHVRVRICRKAERPIMIQS